MDDTLERRLSEIESAFEETEAALSDPETLANPGRLAELGKRHADLREVVSDIRQIRRLREDLEEARAMAEDPDMADLARELVDEIDGIEARVRLSLIPTDPADAKDVILEIRSAAGGDEAAIWAGD
ncbi:MAG TPA: PCRF domain-containing protein, partial [Acidimicrobiia bacterium]|nr:PCRF domain-containing protein [Acidimicrobiia bacterium]